VAAPLPAPPQDECRAGDRQARGDDGRRAPDAVAQPVSTGERLLVVQASIGVVVEQNPATSAEALVERADAEMYRVKPRGR